MNQLTGLSQKSLPPPHFIVNFTKTFLGAFLKTETYQRVLR